jgi:hypothetical protein
MTSSRLIRFLLVTCALVVAVPAASDAQLGGLIKRKITEATKKGGEPEEKKPEDAKTPPEPARSPAERPTGVAAITDESLTGLERGLQTEIDLREQLRTELAANVKSVQEYETCKGRVPTSPEAMQIALRMADLPPNSTQQDLIKLAERNQQDLDALTLKTCGPEVKRIDVAARLEDIQRRAALAARPVR